MRPPATALRPVLSPGLLLGLLLGPATGCAGPGDDARAGQVVRAESTPQREPTAAELRRLRELAETVVVGAVESYDDTPSGRTYVVRVNEVLSRKASLDERAATHPLVQGQTVKVSTFLFRDTGEAAELGPLQELARYVFFLSPTQDAGEWLNLEDAASLRLPDAQPTLDALRALRERDEAAARERSPG